MPRSEGGGSSAAVRGRRVAGPAALAAALLALIGAGLVPVVRVVQPGAWLPGALGLAAAVLAAGAVVRTLRLPGGLATLAGGAVWAGAVTAVFLPGTAWFGVVPTVRTLQDGWALVRAAFEVMAVGLPPLAPAPSVTFLIVVAAGALAVVLDHVAITARLPLLAAVAVIAVALVPAIAVPTGALDAWTFTALAAAILVLLRVDTRMRGDAASGRQLSWAPGAAAVALGSVAVTVALVATPLLPPPDGRTVAAGSGAAVAIDPTLRLGADLRRPGTVEVLRVRTSADQAPYLRAVTLSGFDGSVWLPDAGDPDPVGSGAGFGPVRTAEGVPTRQVDTRVEVTGLRGPYLPVPFPAVAIGGLTGRWGILAQNRTVVSLDADAAGQSYQVLSAVPRPTLEQARAATARGALADSSLRSVPADTPPEVAALAAQVTAGTDSDIDALIALQAWFRSDAFRYSLDAPVAGSFDGPGVEAIGRFLQEREGYCVHFASAFALMARSLGMPARVVVGYLPGAGTGDRVDGDPVYAVTSDLLHAWPEVYFEGLGWVAFEPTNSRGAPAVFRSAGSPSSEVFDDVPAPRESPTLVPDARPDQPADAAPVAPASATGVAGPVLGILVALAVAGAAPGVCGAVRRRRLLAAAASGDAFAVWTFLRGAAVDAGIPLSRSDTPRRFGERLVADGHAPPGDVAAVVAAIERAGYAPAEPGTGDAAEGARVATAARRIRGSLLAAMPPSRRMVARIAPRSLLVRREPAPSGTRSRAR